jgi:hypothetical protein
MPDPDHDSERNDPPPRWVKVFGLVLVLLVLTFVVLHLTGNSLGDHGH